MASEIILRDGNHATVGAGVSDDANLFVTMLRVDPATNYLLAEITSVGATSAIASEIASRDGNHKTVCMAWDATNGVLQEILTDTDGSLLCDVAFV